MAGGSANPLRQQMINMMYLVLTALLALNVSADILKAFALVNGALENTNKAYDGKNGLTMTQFAKLYANDKAKTEKLYNNAQKARQVGTDMFNYLQTIKEDMARMADGWTEGTNKSAVKNDQDLEIAHQYLLNPKNMKATELKNKLEAFEKQMKGLLITENGTPTPTAVNIDFNTQDPPKDKDGTHKTWEEYYFGGVPVIAAITEITKFQNEVRNTEGEVVNYLFKQVGAEDIKFDNIAAIVTSPTPAVYSGDKYQAEVFLGAYSSTQQFEAYVNGQKVAVENGKAKYETTGSGIGEKNVDVKIRFKNAKGQWEERAVQTKYNVFTGSATISATKMNMLYIGLDNPISVSVPGFRPDQIQVSATAGLNLHKEGDHWVSKPSQGTREGTLTVTADGKRVGSMNYRVRPVPKPEILFGTKTGGAMSRGELMTVQYVNAGLGASFAFEGLNYKVTKYTLVFAPRHGEAKFFAVNGNTIPCAVG